MSTEWTSLELVGKGLLEGAEQRLLCALELVKQVRRSCFRPPTVQAAATCSDVGALAPQVLLNDSGGGVGGDVFEASLELVDPWQSCQPQTHGLTEH